MAYVIYKSTRLPATVSYSGATWDSAGIREQYQTQFDNPETARFLAKKLTEFNGVGFKVAEIIDNKIIENFQKGC
jgi:hypothetical protein